MSFSFSFDDAKSRTSRFPPTASRRPSYPDENHTPSLPSETRGSQFSGPSRFFPPSTSLDTPPRSLPNDLQNQSCIEDAEALGPVTPPLVIWSELDDLRSRIKKLELIGRAPQTSAAAMSTATSNRPRDTKAGLPNSPFSPRHRQKTTPALEAGSIDARPSLHGLLRTSLARTKPLVSATLYGCLEATAHDAMALSAMAGPGSSRAGYSTDNAVTVGDRQIRRKAEAMCRNLTELCITLCEGRSPLHDPDPTSRAARHDGDRPIEDGEPATPVVSSVAGPSSKGPSDSGGVGALRSSSRALSRVEARRAVRLQHDTQSSDSPQSIPEETFQPRSITRAGTSLLRAHRARNLASANMQGADYLTFRTPSRAMATARPPAGRINSFERYTLQGAPTLATGPKRSSDPGKKGAETVARWRDTVAEARRHPAVAGRLT